MVGENDSDRFSAERAPTWFGPNQDLGCVLWAGELGPEAAGELGPEAAGEFRWSCRPAEDRLKSDVLCDGRHMSESAAIRSFPMGHSGCW